MVVASTGRLGLQAERDSGAFTILVVLKRLRLVWSRYTFSCAVLWTTYTIGITNKSFADMFLHRSFRVGPSRSGEPDDARHRMVLRSCRGGEAPAGGAKQLTSRRPRCLQFERLIQLVVDVGNVFCVLCGACWARLPKISSDSA